MLLLLPCEDRITISNVYTHADYFPVHKLSSSIVKWSSWFWMCVKYLPYLHNSQTTHSLWKQPQCKKNHLPFIYCHDLIQSHPRICSCTLSITLHAVKKNLFKVYEHTLTRLPSWLHRWTEHEQQHSQHSLQSLTQWTYAPHSVVRERKNKCTHQLNVVQNMSAQIWASKSVGIKPFPNKEKCLIIKGQNKWLAEPASRIVRESNKS